MCVQERRAWFSLIMVLSAFALYAVFAAVPATRPGATAAFALLAALAAEPLVGRKTSAGGRVALDERDREISVVALSAAFAVIWVLFVAAVMIPFYVLGPNGTLTIRTTTLYSVLFPAMGIVYLIRSLVMIVLYRKQANA